ncbi:hypothetical protein DIPPA_27825 [Diplonema papillatum]|nr:hypothetical protein DIPPA_27825 [Diplonema papillatum]
MPKSDAKGKDKKKADAKDAKAAKSSKDKDPPADDKKDKKDKKDKRKATVKDPEQKPDGEKAGADDKKQSDDKPAADRASEEKKDDGGDGKSEADGAENPSPAGKPAKKAAARKKKPAAAAAAAADQGIPGDTPTEQTAHCAAVAALLAAAASVADLKPVLFRLRVGAEFSEGDSAVHRVLTGPPPPVLMARVTVAPAGGGAAPAKKPAKAAAKKSARKPAAKKAEPPAEDGGAEASFPTRTRTTQATRLEGRRVLWNEWFQFTLPPLPTAVARIGVEIYQAGDGAAVLLSSSFELSYRSVVESSRLDKIWGLPCTHGVMYVGCRLVDFLEPRNTPGSSIFNDGPKPFEELADYEREAINLGLESPDRYKMRAALADHEKEAMFLGLERPDGVMFSGEDASVSCASREVVGRKLFKFFSVSCPDKISRILAMLDEYRGREGQLLDIYAGLHRWWNWKRDPVEHRNWKSYPGITHHRPGLASKRKPSDQRDPRSRSGSSPRHQPQAPPPRSPSPAPIQTPRWEDLPRGPAPSPQPVAPPELGRGRREFSYLSSNAQKRAAVHSSHFHEFNVRPYVSYGRGR